MAADKWAPTAMEEHIDRVVALGDDGFTRLEPEPKAVPLADMMRSMEETFASVRTEAVPVSGTVAKPRPATVRVYLLGASGTGKTTLAKHLSRELGCEHLTGAVGNVMKRMGITFDQAMRDMELMDSFQLAIWEEQMRMERPFWENGYPFVSDRGFDLMAYTAGQARTVAQIAESDLFQEYMRRLKTPGTIVMLMRPHPEVKAQTDGRRDAFLSPEWVWKVDGVIEYLLESHRVPYAPVGTACFRDRCRLAARLVKAVAEGG